MRIRIGNYLIKTLDDKNLVIAQVCPAGEEITFGKNKGKIREKDTELNIGYYPNLEWALHKIKDLKISESDAESVDVLLTELEQIDETIRKVVEEVK